MQRGGWCTEIYRSTDKEGRIRFSDQSSSGAELVVLPPANVAPAVKILPPLEPSPVIEPIYQTLVITAPAQNAIIANGPGNVDITIALEPTLRDEDKLQIKLDGDIYHSGRQYDVALKSLPRGSHTLQAMVVDGDDQALIKSAVVTIYVYRPSKLRK